MRLTERVARHCTVCDHELPGAWGNGGPDDHEADCPLRGMTSDPQFGTEMPDDEGEDD